MLQHDRRYVPLLQRLSKHFAGFYHSCSRPQRLAQKAAQVQAVPVLPELSSSVLADPALVFPIFWVRCRALTRTRSHMLAQLQKQEFHQAFSLEKLGFSP